MKCQLIAFLASVTSGVSLVDHVVPVGPHASIIASADFNHDKRPDLAVAHIEDGTVSVWLSDGAGRFHAAPGSPFKCGSQPNDFAIADFNHDGEPDLAIVNTQTPFISIFLGDGHGGFRAAPGSPLRTESYPHPHGVVAGDFSGSGSIDLMTDSWGHDQIEMLNGDGHGGFVPGSFFKTGRRPYQRLRSADLNGDGKPDIVTTNLDADTVSVLLGDGHGGFRESAFKTAPAPWEVAIGDVNRDGKLDLVVIPYDRDAKTRGGAANVTVLAGDGRGGFSPMRGSPYPLGGCAQPTGVAAVDLTGGRWLDIAVTCVNSGQLALLSPDAGGYQLALRAMSGSPYGVAAADFFGTGKMSLAVANSGSGTVTFLRAK